MQFSLHFFKINVCEFLKLVTFLVRLPFQYTPGEELSIGPWLSFVSNNQSQVLCLFVAMVIPYPGRLSENLGLEGAFMWTSPSRIHVFSLFCLCWSISSDSPLLLADNLDMRDERLTGCLNMVGKVSSPQQGGPHSIQEDPGSPQKARAAGRCQSLGTVGLWQLLFSHGIMESWSQVYVLIAFLSGYCE